MSIYKGGYILTDISKTILDNNGQDLLSQDLKDYLSKYISNEQFKPEILSKPIELIVWHIDNSTERIKLNRLSNDLKLLYCLIFNINGDTIMVSIDTTLKIQEGIL